RGVVRQVAAGGAELGGADQPIARRAADAPARHHRRDPTLENGEIVTVRTRVPPRENLLRAVACCATVRRAPLRDIPRTWGCIPQKGEGMSLIDTREETVVGAEQLEVLYLTARQHDGGEMQ